MSRNNPKTAALLRYEIRLDQFPNSVRAWRLPIPAHFTWASYKVREELRALTGNPDLNRPMRVLNNALMATTSLVHGFEPEPFATKPYKHQYYALAITTKPNEYPIDPDLLTDAYDAWMTWWIKSLTADDLAARERVLLMWAELCAERNVVLSWEPLPIAELFNRANGQDQLVYRAVPSLVAALLHGKQSEILGVPVHWYKVQDGGSKRLYLVGMAENRPIHAYFNDLSSYQRQSPTEDEGYCAFKLEFSLQHQSGRTVPWLCLRLRVQRYADEPLTNWTKGRNASLLVGAECFRLDGRSADSTLVRLPITHNEKQETWQWENALPAVIEEMGLESFAVPDEIVTGNPTATWHADAEKRKQDVYYLIHAEGHKYDSEGHRLFPGVSMTDMLLVRDAIHTHLPMLRPAGMLQDDDVQIPAKSKMPTVLRSYNRWPHHTGQKPIHSFEERDEFREILVQALQRATGGEPLNVLTFSERPNTKKSMRFALEEAFMLNAPDAPFPISVQQFDLPDPTLLAPLVVNKANPRRDVHAQRVKAWLDYLATVPLPKKGHTIALVELLRDSKTKRGKYGTRSAIRDAFAQAGITTQMVLSLGLKKDGTGVGKHDLQRAYAAARAAVIKHTGSLFGDTTELFTTAGLDHAIDVIGFYLHQTTTGIRFPIAAKLTAAGQLLVRFPTQDAWLPYSAASPVLGRLFSAEWKNLSYRDGKNKLDKQKSKLHLSERQLREFVETILLELTEPTLALIEADVWRDDRPEREIWPQLKAVNFGQNHTVLDLSPNTYSRDDGRLENLLAVIRIQCDGDTPQYITENQHDFFNLHGLHEEVGGILHYYSVGKRTEATKQREKIALERESLLGDKAAGIAYKHPQVVEFVPFFVHPDYAEQQHALCRVPHLLRHLPYWLIASPVQPYPIHLAKSLIKDQLCILAMDD